MKKNDIRELIYHTYTDCTDPCLKAECDQWRGGECIQIRKAGNRISPRSGADKIDIIFNREEEQVLAPHYLPTESQYKYHFDVFFES